MSSDAPAPPLRHSRHHPTPCEDCGKETLTIGGLCPNCGRMKDPSMAPRPRRYRPRYEFDDGIEPWVIPIAVGFVTAVTAAVKFLL